MLRRLLPILLLTMLLVAGVHLWELPGSWKRASIAAQAEEAKKEEGHGDDKKEAKKDEAPIDPRVTGVLPGPSEGEDPSPPAPKKDTVPPEFDPYADETKPASEIKLLEKLAKQKQDLDTREQDVVTREAMLKANEEKLNQKTAELTTLKTQIEGLLKDSQVRQDAQTKSLVAIYEKMKPKDAARIFDDLDPDTLMNIAGSMKEGKLASVLALMNAGKAKMVTSRLAARTNKLPADIAGNSAESPATLSTTPPMILPAPPAATAQVSPASEPSASATPIAPIEEATPSDTSKTEAAPSSTKP